jgi:hypothetical protein
VVGGLTYSTINPYLQYQNGIDFHLDWGASQFISKNVHIGLVGYYFQQITDDSGPGAKLGGFRGQAIGLGPQIGFIIPISKDYQGYLNIKGYKDLETENRAKTWSPWGDVRNLVGAGRVGTFKAVNAKMSQTQYFRQSAPCSFTSRYSLLSTECSAAIEL